MLNEIAPMEEDPVFSDLKIAEALLPIPFDDFRRLRGFLLRCHEFPWAYLPGIPAAPGYQAGRGVAGSSNFARISAGTWARLTMMV